tara:strand:- start:1430 stop:2323 length:894 start_codon:yes stop_codon:yes gene_type:complete
MKNSYNFLDPNTFSKINNLALRAKHVVDGFIIGLHKSPFHGFSAEFSDHRLYQKGDEIKHIDWKLWAKTDRFYVKQFEEETNLRCQILLDQSKSMQFQSINISKIDYSVNLSASLMYLMLKQQDAVGLSIFDSKIRTHIEPNSKQSHLNKLYSQLSSIKPKGQTDVSSMLHRTAEGIKKRGLIILISDLCDDVDKIVSGLKHFKFKGHELIVFHILDPQELLLSYKNKTKFIDLETEAIIETDPWHIRDEYIKKINEHINNLKNICGKNKIDYVQLKTDQSLDTALTSYLRKRTNLH